MPSRRVSSEHQQTVSRRLAQLSAELATTRDPATDTVAAPAAGGEWWSGHTHVAEEAPALSLVAEPDDPVAPPVPGRHAARRPIAWAGLVPETLRGRVQIGPGQLSVLAVLVALGLAVTSWWVIRGDPEPTTPSAAAPAPGTADDLVAVPDTPPPTGPPPDASVDPAATGGGDVTVDVAGKVRHPGIAVLEPGDRVVDAIEAAGGPRRKVDLGSVNLARPLVDGEQIVVGGGSGPAPPAPPAATGGASGSAPAALVDLNRATQAELETLPEVGPVTAGAILARREELGSFTSVEELLEVDGIGDATLAQLTPHVTV